MIRSLNQAPEDAEDRTITRQYATLERALWVFFNDASVSNRDEYFPEITQLGLLNGHQ